MTQNEAVSMQGKLCMITGATSGIGLATAEALARMGASLVLVGRNPSLGAQVVERIRQETGNAQIEFMLAELTDQAQVRALAGDYSKTHSHLDILINNAGGSYLTRRETVDGLEWTFALNYLSPFLLTNLLLDILRASAPARVINVSSGIHTSASIAFDDLQSRRRYNTMKAYGQAKLALVLFTYELARRLEGSHVTANVLHPGFVATQIFEKSGWLTKLVAPLIKRRAISPEEGAATSIYLASSPEVEGVTGKYFYKCRAQKSAPASYVEEDAHRLWAISEELVGLDGKEAA
jgi:NAD(P)-dependent dehydrogenase (short-subunit alcohol dehydrogenase family)